MTRRVRQGEPHEGGKTRARYVDPQAALRRRYISEIARHNKAVALLMARGMSEISAHESLPPVDLRPFADLRCGARGKRTGLPCPHTGLFTNGRCRWHGGPSTGPRTPSGKARAALNSKRSPPGFPVATASGSDASEQPSPAPGAATDPMTTLRLGQGSEREVPDTAPKSSARRPLLAVIRTCLAERPGRRFLTAALIADLVGVPEATATQALRLLATMGQAESVEPAAGQVPCYWRARRA